MIPSGPSSPGEWAQRHGHHGRWRCPYIQWDRESPAMPPPLLYPTVELRHQQEVGQTERKWFKDTKSPKSEKNQRRSRQNPRQTAQPAETESETTHQAETELHMSPCSCCFCLSWTLGRDGILHYDFALRNRSESPTNTQERSDHTWTSPGWISTVSHHQAGHDLQRTRSTGSVIRQYFREYSVVYLVVWRFDDGTQPGNISQPRELLSHRTESCIQLFLLGRVQLLLTHTRTHKLNVTDHLLPSF